MTGYHSGLCLNTQIYYSGRLHCILGHQQQSTTGGKAYYMNIPKSIFPIGYRDRRTQQERQQAQAQAQVSWESFQAE